MTPEEQERYEQMKLEFQRDREEEKKRYTREVREQNGLPTEENDD